MSMDKCFHVASHNQSMGVKPASQFGTGHRRRIYCKHCTFHHGGILVLRKRTAPCHELAETTSLEIIQARRLAAIKIVALRALMANFILAWYLELPE